MRRFLIFLLLFSAVSAHAAKTRVACVGNSVTFGFKLENRERDSYPSCLQRMLGDDYEVGNFGRSGATLLNDGHFPYTSTDEYRNALEFGADIVIIHLGLNDTDPRDWPNYNNRFIRNYLSLIESFRNVSPGCKVWICRMTPIFPGHPRFKAGTRDWFWQEQQAIESVAEIAGVGLIDLHENLYCRPDLFPDALHPNAEGAEILARTVYSALTGNYGGLAMPSVYGDGMVLQRDMPLRIAGRADAGERVTVRFRGSKRTATTGADGRWEVVFDPMAASSKPAVLSISTPARKIEYRDVLTGDVWLCSGQSNMAFRVDQISDDDRESLTNYAAGRPEIRLFDMKIRWDTDNSDWSLGALDSVNRLQYFHDTEWQPCTPASALRFSAVGMSFGRMLADSLQVPVGLINNSVGGSPAEAWIDRRSVEFGFDDLFTNWRNNELVQPWVRGRAEVNTRLSSNRMQRHPYEPCYLFEAGIMPLDRFAIRGVIWYQGESNAHNIEAHERLFPMVVESWRNYWGNADMPFYYVQLSSLERPSWPQFRDSQRRLMSVVPASGMAVSSDAGDPRDVHPKRKAVVGERLARWALNRTYGFVNTVPSGPLVRAAVRQGDDVCVQFDYADGLQASDGASIRTFEVAEHDGYFFPADVVSVADGVVVIRCDKVSSPRYVRYGWQPYTNANLVNSAGLPASTFKVEIE